MNTFFKLMEIVSVVLDRPMAELDPQHSFYQLGGTSLQAVSLAVKGATHWQVNLSITDILEASSLVELAEKIRVVPLVLSKLSTFEQASVGALSLCFVHAAGGHLEPYRTLQTRYAGRCNLFGLSSPALASIGPDCELAF
ncbi:phosphopantetheine-binding protein [Azotobacter vinelandii]